MRALDGLGPYTRAKAEGDVVRDPDGVFLVLELDHGEHRSEHLLLGNAHLVVHPGKNGGLDEVFAAALLLGGRAAAEHALAALRPGDLNVGKDFLVLGRRGYRADLGIGLRGITKSRLLCHRDKLADKLIVDCLLNEKAGTGDAGLAGRRKDSGNRPAHGIIKDAVVEHDIWRLAAELER